MKQDIVDKIRKYAPTEIDKFADDMDRRRSLDDLKIGRILRGVFNNIDVDRLNPELAFRFQRIKSCLS